MNPTISISDILAFAPEFIQLNQGPIPTALATQVPFYNSIADSVVASPPYPSEPLNPTSGANEIQALIPSEVPVSGNLIVALNGMPSGAILATDNNAFILSKIQAISGIGAGNVSVAGDWTGTIGPPTISFIGALANANQNLLTVVACSFVDGVTPTPNPITVQPVETQHGFAPASVIYTVKMLVICHWLKMSMNTEGQIMMDKVGDLQSQYATGSVNENQDWNESIYGRRYLVFRRIYAFSLGVSPQPQPAPFMRGIPVQEWE